MALPQVRCVGSVGGAGLERARGAGWLPEPSARPTGHLFCVVRTGLLPIGDQVRIVDHAAVQVVQIDAAVIRQLSMTLARVLGDRLAVSGRDHDAGAGR